MRKSGIQSGLLLLCVSVCTSALFVSGCETTEENDVAQAQQCLDGLGANPTGTAATACLNKISGINSAEANTIRCSVDFIVGGITDTAMITAYNNIKGKSGNQVVTYLTGALAQQLNGLYSTAQAAQTVNDCTASGVTSLVYLAGLSQVGTIVVAAAQAATPGGTGTVDTSDPSAFLSTCQTTPTPAACQPATIGSVASTVVSSYCVGSTQTSDVCTSLYTAISNGNGDPTAVGNNILALLSP